MSETKDNAPEGLVEFNGRQIYPEVAEYFRTYLRADREYASATRKIDYEYSEAIDQLRWAAEDEGRRYDRYGPDGDAFRTIMLRRDEGLAAAASAKNDASGARELLLNSPHKEVKWIAEHCLFAHEGDEIEGHARTILKALPATQDELWKIAKDDAGMCDTFDRFFGEAEQAGIFGEKSAALREMTALRSYIRRDYGSNYVRSFMQRVDPIVKALKEDGDKRLAEAKAEWQRLDEAYAENTHRNRSEGARRAAEARRRNAEEEAERPNRGIPSEAPAQQDDLPKSSGGNDGCEICATDPDRIHVHNPEIAFA